MPLSYDIAAYLSSQGIGTLSTTLFIGFMPATPNDCVTVNEYSGAPPLRTFQPSGGPPALERPRIQVTSRATTFAAAQAKATQVQAALDWLRAYTSTDGTVYHLVEALQRPPFPLSLDANGRFTFAANYQVLRASTSS